MHKRSLRLLSLLLGSMLALSACTAKPAETPAQTPAETPTEAEAPAENTKPLYTAGTFEGTGKGNNGNLTVEVVTEADKILSVTVKDHNETPSVCDTPIAQLPAAIVEGQTLAVDYVAGATNTSRAIVEAATDALTKAGADIQLLQQKPADSTKPAATLEDAKTTVVVVGAGAAGMTAAIHTAELGTDVILVEKLGLLGGGDTVRVASYFRAGDSSVQKELGLADATADAYYDTVLKETPNINKVTARTLADQSGAMVDWLIGLGVPFGDVVKTDHLRVRTSDGSAPGPHYVEVLGKELEKQKVDVRLNTKAIDLITEDGKVVGVKVETPDGGYNIRAEAVILCTGGFGNNKELIKKYAPELSDRPTTGSTALMGEGILMAEKVGAKLLSMDLIKTNPVCYESPNGGVSLLSALPYSLLINHDGNRFVNETLAFTTDVANAMMEQEGKESYIFFDQTAIDELAVLKKYNEMGYFLSADTLEELADQIDVDKEQFVKTVEDFRAGFDAGEDVFGRKLAYRLDQPKFYAARVTPSVQNTAGGIAVDDYARVLDTNDQVIPGLYTAGHGASHCGEDATLGAGMCTASFVYGRIVAETAINDLKAN